MNPERSDRDDPRIQAAIAELTGLIRARYPSASFTVGEGEDPEGVYVTATVDVEDTDEVVEVVSERLVTMQVEEGRPIHVIPARPIERVAAGLRERRERSAPSVPPLP